MVICFKLFRKPYSQYGRSNQVGVILFLETLWDNVCSRRTVRQR